MYINCFDLHSCHNIISVATNIEYKNSDHYNMVEHILIPGENWSPVCKLCAPTNNVRNEVI